MTGEINIYKCLAETIDDEIDIKTEESIRPPKINLIITLCTIICLE